MSLEDQVIDSVELADTHDEGGSRRVWAEIRGNGLLIIQGQDLGPGTAMISSDGEYEYAYSIASGDIAPVLTTLGAEPTSDPLTYLKANWSGQAAFDLTRRLHQMPQAKFWNYAG